MENRQQQILSEIKSMMASIRGQLEMLDTKMAELQQIVDPEDFAAESIDIDIEDAEMVETVVAEEVVVQEIPLEEPEEEPEVEPLEEPAVEPEEETAEEPAVVADDLPFGEYPDEFAVPEFPAEPEISEEPELPAEPELQSEPEIPVEPTLDEDLPESIFAEPEVVTVAARAKSVSRPSINDRMADNCAWRRDMPGPQVKDIRSAISLNDRVIFINLLFEEDAQTFVNTLSKINTLESLDQAVEYISAEFPSWDMNSELVYRFMMAVRRKVR